MTDLRALSGRRYHETHPWITFHLALDRLNSRTWLLLGEAQSQSEHVANSPLKPAVQDQMQLIYLSKGAHGTTSIEGNTLTENEVRQRVTGDLELSTSRQYLGDEIDNMVQAYNEITDDVLAGSSGSICANHLKSYHKLILHGQPVSDDVLVGEFREHPVGVNLYRGAPWEDCEVLIEAMCQWLEEDFVAPPERPDLVFPLAVLKAMMAHLYIAWIHPFGDGNGRVARLVEFQLLLQAGVPLPACHLLSDHYNHTREAYYRALDRTSRGEGYPVEVFISYAMQGFVDELRSQLDVVREAQREVTWENYVHDRFRDQDTPARRRQKHIALDLIPGRSVPRAKLRLLSPRVAEEYANKTSKTVSRDLNALEEMGLILRNRDGIRPNRELVAGFLPARAEQVD